MHVNVICVGKGTITVTLHGAGVSAAAPCVPTSAKTIDGSETTLATFFGIPEGTRYSVDVQANPRTHWRIAASEE
ncbi:hypothetical protein ABH923_003513 [Leifsonia sp. EB41]